MRLLLTSVAVVIVVATCDSPGRQEAKLNVVTTTSMITDLVKEIGGDAIAVEGLMGAGIDPHLYKAGEGDVNLLFHADIVLYNGLHLEGKMQEIFEKMANRNIRVVAVSDTLARESLISSSNFASSYDPHIWFDIANWKLAAAYVARILTEADSVNGGLYHQNLRRYNILLDSTEAAIKARISHLPVQKRILITAHDAFNYFGRAYGFEVIGLQGISTASEAGVQDVRKLADLIIARKVNAIFIETSVPLRNVEALQAAVKNRGYEVRIGGSLFSDALGNPETPEGTYMGMIIHNVNTIVDALK